MEYVAIASAVIGALSAISSSQQAKAQYKAQAQANEYNAAVMRDRADTTRSAFNQREEQQRRSNRLAAGKRAAAAAQSGLGLDGSNADVEQQSAVFAELDALNIRYQGDLEARGLLSQASLESWQSGLNRGYSTAAGQQGYLNAAGAVLSSASSYYGRKGK